MDLHEYLSLKPLHLIIIIYLQIIIYLLFDLKARMTEFSQQIYRETNELDAFVLITQLSFSLVQISFLYIF